MSKISIFEKYHHLPEISLLRELSHEIANFQDGFIGKVNHTFILTPWASSMFGFEIEQGRAYLGVPDFLFNLLIKSKLDAVNYINDRPGIFLIFYLGDKESSRPVAIRINMRTARVKSLSRFKEAVFIKMNRNGESSPGGDDNEFILQIKETTSLNWEHNGN